jgi:hypothetical protein
MDFVVAGGADPNQVKVLVPIPYVTPMDMMFYKRPLIVAGWTC